ncbi:PREDICTED: lysophosphatidic acid receptor 1-A-like [Branchiostoma belcheri]|uniref:Lysophosphatidic acid receptor 1-A-like n=1 Tax=Branchiostoma belcheri TaxID=7741 RepID=A0A6P4XRI6_BRABE|nr:PREDICTED: lysophosphatidic acid receptor 1-A-like [Branchiostoma belcheri]
MDCRKSYMYMGPVLVVLVVTIRYAGTSLASGASLNGTKGAGETTNILIHKATLRNGSSVNCESLSATNKSNAGESTIESIPGCPENDSKPLSLDLEFQPRVPAYVAVCLLSFWSVVTNSLPLAAIVKHEQLHTPVYILMANLAAGDVLAGTTFGLRCIFGLYHFYTQSHPSIAALRLSSTSMLLSGMSSTYGLLALTAERYWFIVHGMTYVNNVTNDKSKVVVLIVWTWSVVLAMLPNFGWHCTSRAEDGCAGGGLPHGFIVLVQVCYVYLSCSEAAVGAESSTSRKSAVTVVIITAVFLVGWLPMLVKLSWPDDDVGAVPVVFVILNSAINPIIYGFRLSEVRRYVARLFANCGPNAN